MSNLYMCYMKQIYRWFSSVYIYIYWFSVFILDVLNYVPYFESYYVLIYWFVLFISRINLRQCYISTGDRHALPQIFSTKRLIHLYDSQNAVKTEFGEYKYITKLSYKQLYKLGFFSNFIVFCNHCNIKWTTPVNCSDKLFLSIYISGFFRFTVNLHMHVVWHNTFCFCFVYQCCFSSILTNLLLRAVFSLTEICFLTLVFQSFSWKMTRYQ